MARLPSDVRATFCRVLDGDMSPTQFGRWLIENDDLEGQMPRDDYFALLALKYGKPGVLDKVRPILEQYVTPGELAVHTLVDLLHHTSWEDEHLPDYLLDIGAYYDKGLTFLQPLVTYFTDAVRHPVVGGEARDWDELSEFERESILRSFGPALDAEIRPLVAALKSGEITLYTDDNGATYTYLDRRPTLLAA
ncbi:MAG: hypothetical protein LBR33_02420 [Propionibacteriaceae bacterium]|jgi:hypothetical protein|nr:hypothetical protein [Propionibacteriaceae bacterium]